MKEVNVAKYVELFREFDKRDSVLRPSSNPSFDSSWLEPDSDDISRYSEIISTEKHEVQEDLIRKLCIEHSRNTPLEKKICLCEFVIADFTKSPPDFRMRAEQWMVCHTGSRKPWNIAIGRCPICRREHEFYYVTDYARRPVKEAKSENRKRWSEVGSTLRCECGETICCLLEGDHKETITERYMIEDVYRIVEDMEGIVGTQKYFLKLLYRMRSSEQFRDAVCRHSDRLFMGRCPKCEIRHDMTFDYRKKLFRGYVKSFL